ncbi:hypothetical protein SDC9_48347 [bioreactor metagenome]|uniref:DUF2313 domain-containing protein n=1 Tax=bioreactor metagenome TaxID=1076179 RepID=A0A644WEA4_9ZZZZ
MNLIDYLPDFYKNSAEVVNVQAAVGTQAAALRAAWDDLLSQLNVTTASSWGLDLWETALGITKKAADGIDYRRTRVMSKLRGAGTTTMAMIQSVAESFSNGEVEIIEDTANYTFTVKFVGTIGIPPNMDDLTSAIEEIKPAHLAYSYVIIYRTWDMIGSYTWGQMGAYTWEQVKEGTL